MISPRVARSIKEAEAPELAPKVEDKPTPKADKPKPIEPTVDAPQHNNP